MSSNQVANFALQMIGGAKAPSAPKGMGGVGFLSLFALALLSLLIRAYLVQFTWNMVSPKFNSEAQPLSFMDALLLVILVQNLVN